MLYSLPIYALKQNQVVLVNSEKTGMYIFSVIKEPFTVIICLALDKMMNN